jgi:hypothetical protein
VLQGNNNALIHGDVMHPEMRELDSRRFLFIGGWNLQDRGVEP